MAGHPPLVPVNAAFIGSEGSLRAVVRQHVGPVLSAMSLNPRIQVFDAMRAI